MSPTLDYLRFDPAITSPLPPLPLWRRELLRRKEVALGPPPALDGGDRCCVACGLEEASPPRASRLAFEAALRRCSSESGRDPRVMDLRSLS